MKRKTILVLVAALVLTGCAGAQYAMQNYSGIEPISWASPTTRKSYRIFDKPAEKRLMITLSIGGAAAQGAGAGFTWGLVDTRTPEAVYQDAAIEWLAMTGRKCKAEHTSLVLEPQYEVRYACEEPVPLASDTYGHSITGKAAINSSTVGATPPASTAASWLNMEANAASRH